MIISDEQARLAAEQLRCAPPRDHTSLSHDVSDELYKRAYNAASQAPEFRVGRVAEARERLSAGRLDSRDIASKMLSRIISDSLR